MVDELRSALEIATEDELRALTEMLFRPKFNPLDYLCMPDPLEVQSHSRQEWLDLLEDRFRFLAADGVSVLVRRSDRVTYRQVLIRICQYLGLPYRQDLSTEDLEAEIYLQLIERTWQKLSPTERQQLQQQVRQSLVQSPHFQALPMALQNNPMGVLVKGGAALAVNSVLRPWLLQQIAQQFALQMARYEVARQALGRGGAVAAAQIHNHAAMQMAAQGMAVNAARYGTTRALLAWVGPLLWTWFLADLGWRAIATNYGRVIPVVFTLAQIRLTRASGPLEPAHC